MAGAWFDPPSKTQKLAQENAMNDALQRLIDKDEIRDLMSRYARGVDRADWDGVRETYHKDAYDDHGDYKGGTDGFIEFGRSRMGGATQVMHFLGEWAWFIFGHFGVTNRRAEAARC
jgi:cation transport regulator ChaB